MNGVSSSPEAQIQSQCEWLLGHGYQPATILREHSELLGPWIAVRYVNDAANRSVDFAYFTAMDDGALHVHVMGANRARFSLDNYLSLKGRSEDEKDKLFLGAQEGSPEDRMTAVLQEAKRLIESELLDVIQGKSWIDVPFGWKGHK